jgi:hypothetical protein
MAATTAATGAAEAASAWSRIVVAKIARVAFMPSHHLEKTRPNNIAREPRGDKPGRRFRSTRGYGLLVKHRSNDDPSLSA